jgi:hypothetical protein
MGRALGFRAESQQIHWAVVEGTQHDPILVAHDKAAAPVDLDEASALSWYSSRVRYVIETYHPARAAIRSAEPFARSGNKEGSRRRLRIEGVLLQTMNSCGLKATTGALATISSKLGTKKAKRYVESGEFRGLDLSQIAPLAREAVLVAVAALPENAD